MGSGSDVTGDPGHGLFLKMYLWKAFRKVVFMISLNFVSEVILGMLILWAGSSAFGTVFSIAWESDHENVAHSALPLLCFLLLQLQNFK